MKKDKIFLSIFSISALIWLGISIVRFIISENLILPNSFEIQIPKSSEVEMEYYFIIQKLIKINFMLYAIILISSIGYLITKKIELKKSPLVLTATILFFIFVPFQVYYFFIDYDFIWLVWKNSTNLDEYRYLFLKRISAFGGFSFIEILCYLTILPLIIFNKNESN